jgi:uracil phosphoribosyltransferase
LNNILRPHPDVTIYALRLDRGLSPQAVLKAEPGHSWDQERSLNEKLYIVPGGGGFGEIMNNSFV